MTPAHGWRTASEAEPKQDKSYAGPGMKKALWRHCLLWLEVHTSIDLFSPKPLDYSLKWTIFSKSICEWYFFYLLQLAMKLLAILAVMGKGLAKHLFVSSRVHYSNAMYLGRKAFFLGFPVLSWAGKPRKGPPRGAEFCCTSPQQHGQLWTDPIWRLPTLVSHKIKNKFKVSALISKMLYDLCTKSSTEALEHGPW